MSNDPPTGSAFVEGLIAFFFFLGNILKNAKQWLIDNVNKNMGRMFMHQIKKKANTLCIIFARFRELESLWLRY